MKHMFDGYSMVAKVRLDGGKAFGSQKFIQSKAYRCGHWFCGRNSDTYIIEGEACHNGFTWLLH